jgi:L-aspartate oxidase
MREECDFLVIGSGIAGLCFAIHAAQFGSVVIVTKNRLTESNTNRAQGGISCVLATEDSFDNHIEDTLVAGAGLCNKEAVEVLVKSGPQGIDELVQWGIRFSTAAHTTNPYGFDLGKEGGHSHSRIVHAHDLTGREVEERLIEHLRALPTITIQEDMVAVELITEHHLTTASHHTDNRCYGAYLFDTKSRRVISMRARTTCLATGGVGQIYLHTTNPEIASGDGIGMAYRAGASIANMEFIQFHPTSLFHEHSNSFLISEALRGYGAILKDRKQRCFMDEYHPLKSLAPRDIVARAIDNEMKKSGEPCVFLDVRHMDAERTKAQFPNIFKRCLELGIDITREMIPVVPAAHYVCGGIQVNLEGRSNISGLYACGEVACTGVHGANRLASNSLLEALVFSKRAAHDAARQLASLPLQPPQAIAPWDDSGTIDTEEWVLLSHNVREIKEAMWDYVGIVRSDFRLQRALRRIKLLEQEIEEFYKRTKISAALLEMRNLVTTAHLVVASALKRHESRGLHYTTDYPNRDDRYWHHDTVLVKKLTP